MHLNVENVSLCISLIFRTKIKTPSKYCHILIQELTMVSKIPRVDKLITEAAFFYLWYEMCKVKHKTNFFSGIPAILPLSATPLNSELQVFVT